MVFVHVRLVVSAAGIMILRILLGNMSLKLWCLKAASLVLNQPPSIPTCCGCHQGLRSTWRHLSGLGMDCHETRWIHWRGFEVHWHRLVEKNITVHMTEPWKWLDTMQWSLFIVRVAMIIILVKYWRLVRWLVTLNYFHCQVLAVRWF